MVLIFYIVVVFYCFACVMTFLNKGKVSFVLLLFGFLLHSIFQISRGWLIGIFTPNAIFNEVYFLPWCMVGILVMGYLGSNSFTKKVFLVLICFLSLLSLLFPEGVFPPSP